jgi:hypothetical protein
MLPLQTLSREPTANKVTTRPAAVGPGQVNARQTPKLKEQTWQSPYIARFAESGFSAQKIEPEVGATEAPESSCPVKEKYDEGDVANAAWNIVQNEQSVKNAFLFFSQIKKMDKSKWEEELANLFVGKYKPRIRIKHIKTAGGTREQPGPRKHKKIKLASATSFSVAVSSYLHEMAHYADIWYSSLAARMEGKNRPSVEKKGIHSSEKSDASWTEQKEALGEGVTAKIDQILIDLQQSIPQRNEDPRVPELRSQYQKAQKDPKFDRDKHLKDVRTVLLKAAVGAYRDYGSSRKGEKFSATGIELGFAFEKAAYGFSGSKKGEWAVGFNDKFEAKYCKYLQ